MAANKTPNGFTLTDSKWGGIFGLDIASPVGRLAFVNLATPSAFQVGQTPKYGTALLVEKIDEAQKAFLKGIQDQCKLMVQDLWGARAQDMIPKIKRQIFGNGDTPSSTGKIYEGYEGKWIINARNKFPSGHSQGWKILNQGMAPEGFEAGMLCRLTIQPYLNGDGFSYSLRAIKLVKDDGVRFGGAPDPSGVIDHLDEASAAANANIGSDLSVV